MTIDWERAYADYAGHLAEYLARLVGDREAGSDLMQETFLRGMGAGDSIRDAAAVRAWLYRTATNLAFSHRRRQAIIAFLPFTGAERSPRDTFDVEAEHVRAALRAVSAHEAAALLLFYESGFARVEVAALLGVSDETVKSRLARGRKNFIAAYRRLERGLAQ